MAINLEHIFVKKHDSLIQVWLFDLMNTLLDLFCFMIRHSFRSSLWSSNILKLVHSLGFDFLNFKTLITLSHWPKFLSLTLFTKAHSSLSCRWWVIWHFSEQIFNPQVFRQSLKKRNVHVLIGNGILFPKLIWPSGRKKCSNDKERHLKFETEGQEITRFLRSQAQFFLSVKAHYHFWNRIMFLLVPGGSSDLIQ